MSKFIKLPRQANSQVPAVRKSEIIEVTQDVANVEIYTKTKNHSFHYHFDCYDDAEEFADKIIKEIENE